MSDMSCSQQPALTGDSAPTSVPVRLYAAARLFMISVILLGILIGVCGDLFLGGALMFTGLFGWRGFRSGAIRSLLAMVSVLCVYAWAVPVGKLLSAVTRELVNLPLVPNRHLSILIAALIFILVGQVAGRLAVSWHERRAPRAGRKARAVGMSAGMLEGAVLSMTVMLALVASEPPVRMALSLAMEDIPWAPSLYRQVLRFKACEQQTVLAPYLSQPYQKQHEVLEVGGVLAIVTRYPGTIENLKGSHKLEQLLAREAVFRDIRDEIKLDRSLKDAVQRGDVHSILDSPTVIRLLEDEQLAGVLQQHRDELLDVFMDAVPQKYKRDAARELTRLLGGSEGRAAGRVQRLRLEG